MILFCVILAIAGVLTALWYWRKMNIQNQRLDALVRQMEHFLVYQEQPLYETLEEGTIANLSNYIAKLEEQLNYNKRIGVNREEEMTRFIENMAHQMNNAVTALQIQLDLVMLREASASPGFEKSQACLEQLKKDIDRILKASQLAKGKIRMSFEQMELREEFAACAARLNSIAQEKGISVQFEEGEAIWISGDSFWLSQAFENILKNAIEHSETDSDVRIRLDDCGREIHICIEDEGEGIPSEELPDLFKRFSRGSFTKAGYGIGLSMAKDIVEAHHGTLTAGNREKKGAWFQIVLPVLEGRKTYE